MYTAPLIAGTNRRPNCCLLAMRWSTITAIDHPLLILLEINNWCLSTFTYLWPTVTEGDLTNEDEEWLVTWLTLIKLNWSKRPFEYLVTKSPFLWYRLQRSRYGLIPSTVIEDRSWTLDVFVLNIASRWQSVNQWKSTTTATSSEDSGSTD